MFWTVNSITKLFEYSCNCILLSLDKWHIKVDLNYILQAQGLYSAITSGRKLQQTDHTLYIMKDPSGNG